MDIEEPKTIWEVFKHDQIFINYLTAQKDIQFYTSIHPSMQINLLQWFLWYIGSGVRAFNEVLHGNFSRKDWAFHKIDLMHKYLPKEIWKELVHSSTGYSDKCKTIHFFARNAYSVKPEHLDAINTWLDEVNGRFCYSHFPDDYGYLPGEYVSFHRKRQEVFRKRGKNRIDPLVKKYHDLEVKIRDYIDTRYGDIKIVGNSNTVIDDTNIRKLMVESAKVRIESHIIHENIFNDELSIIEKVEEKSNRGLSQNSNHLWMIKTYRKLIKDTPEGIILENFIKAKKVNI